jgi:hypothetical protein
LLSEASRFVLALSRVPALESERLEKLPQLSVRVFDQFLRTVLGLRIERAEHLERNRARLLQIALL